HAVIAVGLELHGCRGRLFQGPDREVVVALLDPGAQPLELGGHGAEAVGLLDPEVGDVANVHRTVGEERDNRQRLRLVRHVVEVEVTAVQAPKAGPFEAHHVGTPVDAAAHHLQYGSQAGVTLARLRAEVADTYA